MEKQRKYELTKEDLETLIFLAANRICDQKKTSEEKKIDLCVRGGDYKRTNRPSDEWRTLFDQNRWSL